ncbi:MAG: CDP-diacylglycerol--glycerol-3-phosphate 3-phosphatidyltransferase, partial [uncultured Corynebacteriales bacterium]
GRGRRRGRARRPLAAGRGRHRGPRRPAGQPRRRGCHPLRPHLPVGLRARLARRPAVGRRLPAAAVVPRRPRPGLRRGRLPDGPAGVRPGAGRQRRHGRDRRRHDLGAPDPGDPDRLPAAGQRRAARVRRPRRHRRGRRLDRARGRRPHPVAAGGPPPPRL